MKPEGDLVPLHEHGSLELGGWPNEAAGGGERPPLELLISGEIPFLRVKGLAKGEECDALVQLASAFGFSPYIGVEPRIDRLGITVFEHDQVSPEEYLLAVSAARAKQEAVFNKSFNPLDRVIRTLSALNLGTVEIAKEVDGRPYFAGLIRRIEKGTLLHVDFAKAEHSKWNICNSEFQLAWNLYLRTGEGSGPTTIYRRPWLPGDQTHSQGGYGFSSKVVAGVPSVSFDPKAGDLIVFNSRYYHSVAPSRGDRIAIGSAIGGKVPETLWLWS